MNAITQRLLAFSLLVLFSSFSLALDLTTAKQQGLVGEQIDGYVAALQSHTSEEVSELIEDINSRRREKYKEIAAKVGKPLSVVESLAGEKAIAKTLPGNYVQSPDGQWVKKVN